MPTLDALWAAKVGARHDGPAVSDTPDAELEAFEGARRARHCCIEAPSNPIMPTCGPGRPLLIAGCSGNASENVAASVMSTTAGAMNALAAISAPGQPRRRCPRYATS